MVRIYSRSSETSMAKCSLCQTSLPWSTSVFRSSAAALVRSHYHQRLDLDPSHMRLRFWVRVVCAVDILFLILFYLALTKESLSAFNSKFDLKLQGIQSVGVIGALGTVLVLIACLRSWKDNNYGWWAKVWNLL